jgi:uncharacterized protein (DUF1330 family)
MSVYVIAQIKIHDRSRYDKYTSGFMPILKKYNGRLLISDEAPDLIHGTWQFHKIIVLEFADRESANRWQMSPEYEEISKDREAATEGVALLAYGIEASR